MITTRSSQSSADVEAEATVSISYHHDELLPFAGEAEVTAQLLDGRRRHFTIESISLVEGQTVEYVVDPGYDWAWHEVDYLWISMIPEM
ncbi:MAG: hypothetical protein K0V04_06610 [Deltaproteobacteria bacterium]|nr:hypothetical protein [Deltaproteobacteria bacterium]